LEDDDVAIADDDDASTLSEEDEAKSESVLGTTLSLLVVVGSDVQLWNDKAR
jgi:hypothetical protein